jgi:hypothetical protein
VCGGRGVVSLCPFIFRTSIDPMYLQSHMSVKCIVNVALYFSQGRYMWKEGPL